MAFNLYFVSNLFCLLSLGMAVEWPYRDCANKEIKKLSVDPCGKIPCSFKSGDPVNVTLEFVANQNTDNVKLYGSLRTGGLFAIKMPYIGIDDNACNRGFNPHKLPCPLEKGKTYKFVLTQTVPFYSRFNVFRYTTWRLVGDNGRGDDLTCAEFDIYQDMALNRYFSQFASNAVL